MTDIEKITNNETREHILNVTSFLCKIIAKLSERIPAHDRTKLESPELEIFVEYTPKLKGTTYGSDEYKQFLAEMHAALNHHYKNNRHHPEHFENGVNDMTLIDIIEMLCDWKAATLRHNDGDIFKSIEHNKSRFNISDQLAQILYNTANIL